MKLFLFAVLALTGLTATAQNDTLSSGIYSLPGGKVAAGTSDLAMIKAHASTLAPGKTNHPPRALNDVEELVFIKEGTLKVIINDSSKVVGPGSLVLIMAGDVQNFQNTSDKPATYYVLTLKSKLPVDVQRGKQAGGSLIIDWNTIAVKKTDKGESRPIFDRPTSMFKKLEVHATLLNGNMESHPPHTHREEEMMLVMQGDVSAYIAGKDYSAAPGDMILCSPNILHGAKNAGKGPCWYYAVKWVD